MFLSKFFKKSAVLTICLFSVFPVFSRNLPEGYGGIELGMSVDETKKNLKANIEFGYHGDRDVSLLPGENRVLIETEAFPDTFLERCWFQFYKDRLYTITINLNREKMDHYSIFTTLCKKYGNPDSVSPEKSVWKSDEVVMSLERPLTLKYVDVKTFDELRSSANVSPAPVEITREMFLEGL